MGKLKVFVFKVSSKFLPHNIMQFLRGRRTKIRYFHTNVDI